MLIDDIFMFDENPFFFLPHFELDRLTLRGTEYFGQIRPSNEVNVSMIIAFRRSRSFTLVVQKG